MPKQYLIMDALYLIDIVLTLGIHFGFFPQVNKTSFNVPDFPDSPEKGSHDVGFAQTIFIERTDFKEKGEKGYRRLTMEQDVGLRYAGLVLTAVKVVGQNEIDAEVSATKSLLLGR